VKVVIVRWGMALVKCLWIQSYISLVKVKHNLKKKICWWTSSVLVGSCQMYIPRISGPPVFKWCLSPVNTTVTSEKQSEISEAGLQSVMRAVLAPNCKTIELTSVVILMHSVCVVCSGGFFLLLFVFCCCFGFVFLFSIMEYLDPTFSSCGGYSY